VCVLRRDFAAVLVWALFLAGLTAAQLAFMRETYSYGLLGGAALVTVLLGVFLFARRERAVGEGQRFLPDLSYATVALGLGVAAVTVGVPFGTWLLLPGLGLLVLGAGGLAREHRAERRGRRA
jgi:hypothetical protein